MVSVFQRPLTADAIKAKARELGADLVGIADGKVLDQNPPDPRDPRRPSDISALDADRVIVLAKRYSSGSARIVRCNDRHKYYNDELALTALEETSLALVYWLEDNGYPALIVPPTHTDPWRYVERDPRQHMTTLISLPHAAVEAGLGTLGLNLQLLTPEYGPRVLLTAVLSSVPCAVDTRREEALCQGPSCGRCLKTCPGDTVGHWDRDWVACDRFRSPHGFGPLVEQLERVLDEPDSDKKKAMIRTEETFNLWQSILRGAGVVTGCRRCQDVCPVGADYGQVADALAEIPENTPEKELRLAAMLKVEARHSAASPGYEVQRRWIGRLGYRKT